MLQTIAGHLAASIRNARLLEALSFDATHDALTGLNNRSKLIDTTPQWPRAEEPRRCL